MCGRYTFAPGNLALFAERFGVGGPPESACGYNIPPGRPVATVVHRAGAHPSCEMFHWGLIPAWAQSTERPYKMINARVETVAEKRAYSGLLQQHRCLIPADGFFEWQAAASGPKQPWWFHLPNAELFAFAGLWTSWQPQPEVEPVNSCTILTTAANEVVSPVHGRMPLILRREDESRWINPEVGSDEALSIVNANANEGLVDEAVARNVNDTRNAGPECIAPADDGDVSQASGALF